MAASPSSRSVRSSISASSLSSSVYDKGKHGRPLPRRGQIKGAIIASIFASIARLLGARTESNSEDEANSQNEAGSHADMSDLRVDAQHEGGDFCLSVRSSPASQWSVSATPDSSAKPLSRSHSFHEG